MGEPSGTATATPMSHDGVGGDRDRDLLTLTQWLSPAFPIGGFAYSHGQEAAVRAGDVRTAENLRQWLGAILSAGSGLADAVLLSRAMAAGADHALLCSWAAALAVSKERWDETSEQGAAFTRVVNALTGSTDSPAPLRSSSVRRP